MLCDLVPGGIPEQITAVKAAHVPGVDRAVQYGSAGPLRARCRVPGDLRRIDAQMRDTKKKLALVVRASGTTLSEIGLGPVIAATMIGYVADSQRGAPAP